MTILVHEILLHFKEKNMKKNEIEINEELEIWKRIIIIAVDKFSSGDSEIIDRIAKILRVNDMQF